MKDKFTAMARKKANIDFSPDKLRGEMNFGNHSFGIGGIHSMPMPDKVVSGMKRLKPKLARIFIQEFFYIYDGETLDFTKLDAYMKAVSDTGADVMASICIKPYALYPTVDETVWRPNDVEKWQWVIYEMVKRYSVDFSYVTHWGVGNEMNIGEFGGCPYKVNDVGDYYEYYKMTTDAILRAFSSAKVGGPSFAGASDETFGFFDKFLLMCKKDGTQVDFVSYNIYSDSAHYHADSAAKAAAIAKKYGDDIQVYVTEMNIGIGGEVSLEEKAYSAKRAAGLASIILEYQKRAPEVGTFQYHIYDQFCDPDEFAPFYARHRYMANHWNDEPHRLGLFDLGGRARPQYYMYAMLGEMAGNEAAAVIEDGDVKIAASSGDDGKKMRLFLTNYNENESADTVVSLYFKGAPRGKARLTVRRIDDDCYDETRRHDETRRYDETRRHDGESLSVTPSEDRVTYLHEDFWFSVFVPADSCALISIDMI